MVHTLLAIIFEPIAGRLADAYGRRPCVLGPQLILALLRYRVSMPGSSPGFYFLYRQMAFLAQMPFTYALRGMISDLLGRGSDASFRLNRRVELAGTVVRVVMTRLLRYLPDARYGFRCAAHFNLAAFVLLLIGTLETRPTMRRRAMSWDKTGSKLRDFTPLNFLRVFGQSKGLRAMAVLTVAKELPNHNGSLLLFRRLKHGWGQKEQSNQMLLMQACSLGKSFVQGPIIRFLGLRNTFQWGERLGALMDLNTVLSRSKKTFYMNPFFSGCRQSDEVLDRVLDTEARMLNIGQGELAAARENLLFFQRLVMPSFFSEVYVRTLERIPGANFLLNAVLQLISSEVIAPWAWRQLRPEMLENVSTA